MLIDKAFYFSAIRSSLLPTMTQSMVDGQNAILDAWSKSYSTNPLCDLAYILATAYHESGHTFQAVREIGQGRGRPYGVPAGPYNQVFYGRGLCQLTHIENYTKFTAIMRQLGFLTSADDMTRTPDLALRPDVSAAILIYGSLHGTFTGRSLANYLPNDSVNARRVINGTDRAELISGFYAKFLAALRNETVAVVPPVVQSPPVAQPTTTTVDAPAPASPVVAPAPAPNVFQRIRNTFDEMHAAFSKDRT